MIYRPCLLARIRFTVGYVAALAVGTTILMHGHAGARPGDSACQYENLHNLAHGHLGTLWNSAFVVTRARFISGYPACRVCSRSRGCSALRLTGGVRRQSYWATLLVAAVCAGAIEIGWLPWSSSRSAMSEMSYGALAALGALTAAIPGRWRPAWIGWWVSLGLATATIGVVSPMPATQCIALGMLLTHRFPPGPRAGHSGVCLAGGGV